jgi:multidrug resistance efflux pump
MIVFLTVCYIGLLWMLVKVNVLKWTLPVKLSPIAWVFLLLVVLFIPMQFSAPSGPVTVYGYVIEIVPRVSGRVIEVPIKANVPIKKGDVLFKIDPEPYQAEVDRLEAAMAEAEQNVPQLKAAVTAAEGTLEKAQAQKILAQIAYDKSERLVAVEALQAVRKDKATADLDSAKAMVKEAEASLERAKLAYGSEIEGVNTTVALRKAQLAKALIDLRETTVYAPADGVVVQLTLRPGFVVVKAPLRQAMAFIASETLVPMVLIGQNYLRFVRSGQNVELVSRLYPGKVLKATVEEVVRANGQGQIVPSGQLVTFDPRAPEVPFAVRLKMNEDPKEYPLILGSRGTGAVYTKKAEVTHIIRKVMLRMDTWLNYII